MPFYRREEALVALSRSFRSEKRLPLAQPPDSPPMRPSPFLLFQRKIAESGERKTSKTDPYYRAVTSELGSASPKEQESVRGRFSKSLVSAQANEVRKAAEESASAEKKASILESGFPAITSGNARLL